MNYKRNSTNFIEKKCDFFCVFLSAMHLNSKFSVLLVLTFTDYAERLFDLVDNFAENSKRKAAVWPLQTMLLILCPVSLNDS